MKTMACPCCGGKGKVELRKPLPIQLAPIQSRIYRAVQAAPDAIGGQKLIEIVYSDRRDGGPESATACIHTLINQMNKRLAKVGEKLCADRRGAGATYRIVKLDVV